MWAGKVTRAGVDQLAFGPDGRTLFTRDGPVVRAWDTASHEPTVLMTDAEIFPSLGNLLPADRTLYVAHGTALTSVELPSGRSRTHRHPKPVLTACLLPDEPTLLTTGTDCVLRGWSLPDVQAVELSPAFPTCGDRYTRLVAGAGGRVVGLVYEPPGHSLVVWDVPADRAVATFRLPPVLGLADPVVSPDGTGIAFGLAMRFLVVDLPSGRTRFDVQPARTWPTFVAWHPGGKVLAVAGATPVVYFLDVRTGGTVARYDWKIGKVRSLAFSPDGATCAAGGSNRAFAVWDVDF